MLAWIRDKVGEYTPGSALSAKKSFNIFSLPFGAYLLLYIYLKNKHKENILMGIRNSLKVLGRIIFSVRALSLHIWIFPLLLDGLYLIAASENL